MTKIKAKIIEKQVKLAYPSRSDRQSGRTHRTEQRMSVTVTDIDYPDTTRVLIINRGQLKEIISALHLLHSAGLALDATSFKVNSVYSLIESLSAIDKVQPGLDVVEAEGFEEKS